MWTEREDMFNDPFAYAMVPIRNRKNIFPLIDS